MPLTQLLSGMALPTLAGLAMLLVLMVARPLLPIAFPSIAGLLATIVLGVAIYGGAIAAFDKDGFRLALSLVRRT